MIQHFLGVDWSFPAAPYILFGLSTAVYFYGGQPFLKGLADEVKARTPGMMFLIGFAITVAYAYSVAVVFGLKGEDFFWELATLILIMLLGHWIEMRSVAGASKDLEMLVQLMPADAHLFGGSINGNGSFQITVSHSAKDSYLAQVVKLVDEAQKSRSKTQLVADTAAKWLTVIAILAGLSAFLYWDLSGQSLSSAMARMVTVMVICSKT